MSDTATLLVFDFGLRVVENSTVLSSVAGKRQNGRNTTIAKVRARVEHVFAGLNQMGGLLVRRIGLARADFQITTKLAVYNLKRFVSMRKCGVEAF